MIQILVEIANLQKKKKRDCCDQAKPPVGNTL